MPTRQFVVEESWGPHYNAVSINGDSFHHRFFIQNFPHDPKKPDLILHDTDADGPTLGLAQFRRLSSNCDIRLENGDDGIHLSKQGVISPSYKFQMLINGQRRYLAWKKTRSLGNHHSPHGNIKLVDEKTNEALAVFSRDGFLFVPGYLDIFGAYDDYFDQVVLLTGLAVREQQRRQSTRSVRAGRDNVYTMGAAGGGAGGGGS